MEDKKIEITKEVLASIDEIVKKFFELSGLTVEISVEHDKDNDSVNVLLDAPDSAGLIIGRRGETISALGHIFGMMARTVLGGWVRVIVNLGDYREKQETQLKDLAVSTANRVRETRESQSLYNLTPSQRRVIHMTLAEEEGIVTTSEGEGRDRHLVVSIKE